MLPVSDPKVCGGWVVCKPISVLSFDKAEQNSNSTLFYSIQSKPIKGKQSLSTTWCDMIYEIKQRITKDSESSACAACIVTEELPGKQMGLN